MRRAVVLILDGLRRDLVRADTMPFLHGFRSRATSCEAHRSVFPSATRVVSACFATGCHPNRHGLQGNTMVLVEHGRPVVHDAGRPEFLQHKRAVTGHALAVPTLAKRLRGHGGVAVFNNVSPGAAYAHDPDGDGRVYHRVGSFGPGRQALPEDQQMRVTPDLDGDRAMTERFVEELRQGRSVVSVMWCGEPDTKQHQVTLGSPEHRELLAGVDRNAAAVAAAVEALRGQGDDVLFLVGSDHGHQTVTEVVDVEAALVAAGLKDSPASEDVVAVSNGTAALVYVMPGHEARLPALAEFLRGQDWAGPTYGRDALHLVGQSARNGLAFAVSMRDDDAPNAYGVSGLSRVMKPAGGKPDRLGAGQHGGLARYEQSPLLVLSGPGFEAGATCRDGTSIVDIAPTILRHLGHADDGMDGRALQGRGTREGG